MISTRIKLSIIIASYNTKKLLVECLETLFKARQVDFEIIVVDNASSDGSADLVEQKYIDSSAGKAGLKIIKNQENLGFAKATNQGIKRAKGDNILLLNSDTMVNPEALKNLINFVEEHSDAGIIGARLLNTDGTIQPSVFHLPTIKGAIKEFWLGKKGSFGKYFPEGDAPIEVEAVVGAAMLITRIVIDKVGLLDERYFMYFEDLDYCRRVKKAGFRVYYFPKSKIIHLHGKSGEKIGEKTNTWLIESSKIYHGIIKYWILTIIIRSSQIISSLLKPR